MSLAELSDQIGRYLCTEVDRESDIGKISYGIECALVLILSLTVVLTIGGLAGVFGQTTAIAGSLLVVKYIIGGPHLSGFVRCVVYSTVYIVGSALLLKTLQPMQFSTWSIGIVIVGETVAVWFYAPLIRDGINLTGRQTMLRKCLTWLFILAVGVLNLYMKDYHWRGILIGIFLAIFNVTPWGVGIVNLLESITKKRGDEAM